MPPILKIILTVVINGLLLGLIVNFIHTAFLQDWVESLSRNRKIIYSFISILLIVFFNIWIYVLPLNKLDFYFGYVEDSSPISFTENGNFRGYCAELYKDLRTTKYPKLKRRPIKLAERFKQTDNKLAIDCGPNTITLNRKEKLKGIGKFSDPFFTTGASIIIRPKDIENTNESKKESNQYISLFQPENDTFFSEIKLGVLENTTTYNIISNIYPLLTSDNLKKFKTINELLDKLDHGQINGFISDNILLKDYKRRNPDKQKYIIIPENHWLSYEKYGIVIYNIDNNKTDELEDKVNTWLQQNPFSVYFKNLQPDSKQVKTLDKFPKQT